MDKCGFQESTGVQTAFLRASGAHRQRRKVVILDLKSAYQGVLRDKLMEMSHVKADRTLANQIHVMLLTNVFYTVGDDTNTKN